MAETTPPSTEKTVVMNNAPLCRLWTFVIISLSLNVLILVALLICAVVHHCRETHPGFGGPGGGQCQMGYGHHFDHFHGGGMSQGWGRPGGGGEFGGHQGGPGMMGGRGMGGPGGFRGHGGGGMMGGRDMGPGSSTPPDPAQMADMILNHLSSKLTLTDDEKAKIKPIIEQQTAQMQKDREAQHQDMLKSVEDTRAKIKPLLTPDQQKELDALPLPGQKPADDAKPGPKPGQ